jgi:hypothetical protein
MNTSSTYPSRSKLTLKTFCLCLLLFSAFAVGAQPAGRAIVDQQITWASYISNVKLSDRLTLFLDGQFRYVASAQNTKAMEPMQTLLRTIIDYNINKKLSVSPLGYARVINHLYGKQPNSIVNNEHRLYQQIFYKHSLGKLNVNHRLRLEERFIQSHDALGADLGYKSNKQFRARYRLMMNLPLNTEKVEKGTWSSTFFYEGFISKGKSVTFNDIDQSRLFLGLTYQATKNLSVAGGYYYQMLVKSNGAKQENNLGALIMVTHNFDLSKKED